MPPPISLIGEHVDLKGRFFHSTTVAASPTAGTETIICTLTINNDVAVTKAIYLFATAAFTVGTNGVSANLKIRQTDASGTTLWASGATTVVAANLWEMQGIGVDASPTVPGQVYVVTLTVGSASAGSTVSAAALVAVAV